MSGEDRNLFLRTMQQMKNLQIELSGFRGEMKEFKESVKDRITKLETHKSAGFSRVFTVLMFCVSLFALTLTILTVWDKKMRRDAMLLQWNALLETEKKQGAKMSEKEKYVYFLLMQYRSPYLWGKENPEGADCSGAVCLALMMSTGCEVRTTADGLLKKFFTNRSPKESDISAVFYTARTDRRHGDPPRAERGSGSRYRRYWRGCCI